MKKSIRDIQLLYRPIVSGKLQLNGGRFAGSTEYVDVINARPLMKLLVTNINQPSHKLVVYLMRYIHSNQVKVEPILSSDLHILHQPHMPWLVDIQEVSLVKKEIVSPERAMCVVLNALIENDNHKISTLRMCDRGRISRH